MPQQQPSVLGPNFSLPLGATSPSVPVKETLSAKASTSYSPSADGGQPSPTSKYGDGSAGESRTAPNTPAPTIIHIRPPDDFSPSPLPSPDFQTRKLHNVLIYFKAVQLLDIHEAGCETLLVEINKIPDRPLGMGVGKRSRGILITSVQVGSPSAEKLRVGDRILAVNGQPVTDQQSAVSFVKSSGARLILQIARPKPDSNNLQSISVPPNRS
uniref:PDZ domain-containing protein n=1 Tax=Romanomermis culicivorax TaxID=13658 RepID=A0A915JY64_ROMCU